MSKYRKFERKEYERPYEVHPVWRGIGCLLILLTPIIAYAGAETLVRTGLANGWPLPPELLGYIHFPGWVQTTPVLSTIAGWIGSYPNLLAVLVGFVILLFLLSGLFSTLYAIIYRSVGPSRYSKIDVPPPHRKVKPYKR